MGAPSTSLNPSPVGGGRKPLSGAEKTNGKMALIYLFLLVPLAALVAAVPLAWGWGLSWVDVGLSVFFFYFTGLGVTIGYHRHFTHGSFKARKGLRVVLAIAGSMAVQMNPVMWVATHRRHHAFADKEGDPHSPWLFGTGITALLKGFWHAHMGWNFNRDTTNTTRFAPDLLADRTIVRISKQFPLYIALSFLLPAVLGGCSRCRGGAR